MQKAARDLVQQLAQAIRMRQEGMHICAFTEVKRSWSLRDFELRLVEEAEKLKDFKSFGVTLTRLQGEQVRVEVDMLLDFCLPTPR